MSKCPFIKKENGKIEYPILDYDDLLEQIDRDTWEEIGRINGWFE